MLQAFLVKKLFGMVFKALLNKYDLDGFKSYVEDENELDIEVRKMKEDIILLKQDSHPVADFVCTEHGCKASRMEREFQNNRHKKKKRRLAK